jgi:hypothetical protein
LAAGVVTGIVVPVALTVLTLDWMQAFGISQIFAILQGMIAIISAAAFVSARRTHARSAAIVAGTWLAVSAGGCCLQVPVVTAQEWRAQSRGDSIVQALAEYRAREKKYPLALAQLVPSDLSEVPDTGLRVLTKDAFAYRLTNGGDEYELTYYGAFMMTCSRSSATPWRCID